MKLHETPLHPERAVFDLDLLLEVAKVHQERSSTTQNRGVRSEVRPYTMNGLIYCFHCEQRALEQDDPKFRTRLRGHRQRYGHKEGVYCGCTNRSVTAAEIEDDFGRLLQLLSVRQDALGCMTELAIQADKLRHPADTDYDPEVEK